MAAHAAAAALAGGILFILVIVKPAGMGMGDAKLAFLIGLALGSRTIAAMVFTSAALIVLAIGLVLRHGPRGPESDHPVRAAARRWGTRGVLRCLTSKRRGSRFCSSEPGLRADSANTKELVP